MCVRDFNKFVMGTYNIHTMNSLIRVPCAQRSEQNIKGCDAVTVELAVEHSEIINSAEPKRYPRLPFWCKFWKENLFPFGMCSEGGVHHRARHRQQ